MPSHKNDVQSVADADRRRVEIRLHKLHQYLVIFVDPGVKFVKFDGTCYYVLLLS